MSVPDFKFLPEWDRFDTAAILSALIASHKQHLSAGNPIAKVSCPTAAYRRIMSGEQPALLVNGYLVVYQVSPVWSGDVPVVMEEYVLAVSKRPGSLRGVVKALEAVAEAAGAAGVFVGNSSGDPRLSRFYEAQGFVTTGTQFYKEAPHGRS